MNVFGQRLRAMGMEVGLPQTDIAKELGITRNAAYRYEAGLSWPPMETLCYFADKYKCSVDYLLGRTEVKGTPQTVTVYPERNEISLDQLQSMMNTFINQKIDEKEGKSKDKKSK